MNLPPSRYLKECLKSVNILKNYGHECVDTFLIYVGRGFFSCHHVCSIHGLVPCGVLCAVFMTLSSSVIHCRMLFFLCHSEQHARQCRVFLPLITCCW